MISVRFVVAGRARKWISNTGKHRTEEIYDTYVDGKLMSRGICRTLFRQVFGFYPKKGEAITYKISKVPVSKSRNVSECSENEKHE